jgi:DNA segregation ATPase FtsK/SpoIIIE, S-DNA-T family
MKKRRNTRQNQDTETSSLKNEIMALLLIVVGAFYFLCIVSYNPLDPSFFSSGSYQNIANLGGVIGSYMAGAFFFLFGGASYFLGLYFFILAILIYAGKRSRPKIVDFIIFVICTTFISIFLQLFFIEFSFGQHNINAGGTLGNLLAEIGQEYLGLWGVYLLVSFGAALTFILATRLSFFVALSTSSVLLGRSLKTISNHLYISLIRLHKALMNYLEERRELKKEQKEKETKEKRTIKIEKRKPVSQTEGEPLTAKEIDTLIGDDKVIEPRIRERKDVKPKKNISQMELQNISEGYQLPSLAFLDYDTSKNVEIDENSLKMSARILESKLKDFAIEGRVTEIHPGPVITMFEFQPAPGVKLSRINSLTDDLSMAMGGRSVRIVAPLPNKAAIGIEIPNHTREIVWLKDILVDERFQKQDSKLQIALGKDIEGVPFVTSLQKMPHLLVAGSTGSGKSVAINTMITSILYTSKPDEVRMILIDPKMIELSIYDEIPHLMLPVVTDPNKANLALKWAVREMERRYKLLSDLSVRNVAGYNKKIDAGDFENKQPAPDSNEEPIVHDGRLPYIVIVIDEFADLMMSCSKDIETTVCRLAQKARAAGLHLIIATQRPSVDVITGLIKANFPSRISFRVTSKHDARTILDTVGAEHLLGMGDMLFIAPGSSKLLRIHGAFISEKEIIRIVDALKKQAKPCYQEEILEEPEMLEGENGADDYDEYYDQAVRVVCDNGRVSISSIQRQFRIGYNRAARIVEQMEHQGIVSSPNGQGQREVLANQH